MSETERPNLRPDDHAPSGYVRVPHIGLVHVGALVAGGGLVAWLLWKAWK